MTISVGSINFKKTPINYTATKKTTVTNNESIRKSVQLLSDNSVFIPKIETLVLEPKIPANSTIYFVDENYNIQNSDGSYETSPTGYGIAGTTDASSDITFSKSMPSIAITAPTSGSEYKFDESFDIEWSSSNVVLVDIIIESESGGYKEYLGIDSSLGIYSVSFNSGDGFSVNEIVYVYVKNAVGSIEDSVQLQSIATLGMTTPTGVIAGEDYDYEITSNGLEVSLYQRTSETEEDEAGEWVLMGTAEVVDGECTITGSIADAGTYDFKAVDTINENGFVQIDNINVASAQNDGQYMFAGDFYGGNAPRYSSNYGTSFTAVGSSKSVYAIAVVDNGDFAIFGAYQSIFKIDKNGTLTTLKSTGTNSCRAVACSSNGQYILAFVLDEGLYKSSDYGANWTLVSNNTAITEKIFVSSDGSKQCYFTNQRPFFSSDYGSNWTQRDTSDRNWGNICGSDDGGIIYGYLNGGSKIFKFTSNGATITQVGTSRTWYHLSCSKDGSVVAAAIYQNTQIDYSTDSGASWGLKNTNALGYYAYRLVVVPDGSKIIVVADASGQRFPYMITAPFSSNSFAKLIDSNQAWGIPAVSNDGKYILIGPSSDNKLYYSQDFGANFSIHAGRTSTVAMNRKRT